MADPGQATRGDGGADSAPRQLSLFGEATLVQQPVRPTPPLDASAPIAAALPAFARWLAGAGKAPQTIAAFTSDLRQLAAFYPGRSLTALTTADLERFLGYLRQDRRLAEKSVERKVTALKSFGQFLLAEGVVAEDPARRLLYPALAPPLPEVLTDEEVVALLAAAADRPLWHALIATLRYAGPKREEALALQRGDIVLDEPSPVLTLRKRRPSRYGRDRVVPLVQPLRDILRAYLTHLDGAYLFPLHVRSVAWGLSHYAARAGIAKPVSAQTLRDTFAVAWLRERLPSEREVERLGLAEAAAALRARHDHELLALLGLAEHTAPVALAKYRALAGDVRPPTARHRA
jgi:integrase/recombinase XerC